MNTAVADAPHLNPPQPIREGLRLHWSDGIEQCFSLRWLRSVCVCDTCGDSASGKRWSVARGMPRDPRITEATREGADLHIAWQDGHRSHYPGAWLRTWQDEATAVSHWEPQRWDGRFSGPARFDWQAVPTDAATRWALLRELRDRGIALLDNVPATRDATLSLTAPFGDARPTNYGPVCDLESVPDAQVAGSTHRAQLPHTDEPFRYHPPGFIFFHCLQAGADAGGTSLMMDGFAVAERLRREHPAAFALLQSTPLLFHRHHAAEVDFRARGAVFPSDGAGRVLGMRFNDRCLAPLDLPSAQLPAAFDAIDRLVALLADPELQCRLLLEPGQALVFDNHRILHGRTEFDPSKAHRHLRSCHIDREVMLSQMRLLARQFAPQEAAWELRQGV